MKENVLDVLMYLFENYFYDEPDDEPDRESMEENLHLAGFSNAEIDKAFDWLDGLAEQRYQPDFLVRTEQPNGSLAQGGGNMYSHGLAAIAPCEAYAMTNERGA